MSNSDPAKIPEKPYGDIDLAKIAKALEVESLTEEQVQELQRAAQIYLLLHSADPKTVGDNDPAPIRPGYGWQRTALNEVAKAARALARVPKELRSSRSVRLDRALNDQGLWFGDLYKRRQGLELSDPRDLERLALIAEELRKHIPPRGHEPKQARLTFIRRLIPIYESIAGKKPGRRVRWKTGKEYGPFKQIVCAALEPLNPNPSALKGIDADIKKALSESASKAQQTS